MKRAFVAGVFDLPHYGHYRLFRRIKRQGYKVIVCLVTDEFTERYKGTRPILNLNERWETLQYCKEIDEIIINHKDFDFKTSVIKSKANIIFHGDDWETTRYKEHMGFTNEWLNKHGLTIKLLPYTQGISTTDIKQRIKQQ